MLVNAGVSFSQNAGEREIFENRDAKILKMNLEDFCNPKSLQVFLRAFPHDKSNRSGQSGKGLH